MYTLNSPLADRFGTKVKGTFKCAYKNEKIILIAGFLPIAALAVMLVISAVLFSDLLNDDGSIKGGLVEVVIKNGEARVQMTEGLTNFSVGIISGYYGLILLAVLIAAYIVFLFIIRAGRSYKFEANENGMTIYYPGGKVDAFRLEDVTRVRYKERKALIGSRGFNVTVSTKNRDYDYRLIHDHLTKANGFSETPFNIPKEYVERPSLEDESFY